MATIARNTLEWVNAMFEPMIQIIISRRIGCRTRNRNPSQVALQEKPLAPVTTFIGVRMSWVSTAPVKNEAAAPKNGRDWATPNSEPPIGGPTIVAPKNRIWFCAVACLTWSGRTSCLTTASPVGFETPRQTADRTEIAKITGRPA